MKKITLLMIGLTISIFALSASAREGDGERLTLCESELRQFYGEETRLKLKSISHKSGGAYLRLKAIPSGGDSQVVTCQVTKSGDILLLDRDGVALSAPDYDAAGKVSSTH